jgi:hypothetical protein
MFYYIRQAKHAILYFFQYYIWKVLDYAKVLWNDHDFDFMYVYSLIEIKTRRTREYLTKEGLVTVDTRRMKEVEWICKRLRDDEYHGEILGRMIDQSSVIAEMPPTQWVHTLLRDEKVQYEFDLIVDHISQQKETEKKRLFYLLEKYGERWWS